MSESEKENILQLALSPDKESKKLAIGLLEQEYPYKLSYNEYLQEYQKWFFDKSSIFNFLIDMIYYNFIHPEYTSYLGLNKK